MANKTSYFYEFGPFRIDPVHRLLLREKQPVPLQPKAFDILVVLVENSEKVVLKDDLLKAVWPDTFVEESNLAQNIFVLRKTLGDAVGENRYIVTVPGRGYRFVGEVRAGGGEEKAEAELIVRSRTRSDVVIEERNSLLPMIGAVAVISALALAAGAISYRVYHAHRVERSATVATAVPVKVRRSVAVLGFRDLSGRPEDAWLSTALAEMLNTELAAGEKLRLVPGEDVARTKLDLLLPDADSLSKDTLSRVHRSLGTDVVVLGSYASLGGRSRGSIRVDLRLQDAVAGETIAEVATTGTEDDLFDLVSRAGRQLREKLGLGAVTTSEAVSVKASLPANPEAARLYAEGVAKQRVFDALAARDLLQRAVAADPKYPLTRAALSAAWSALGYDKKAQEEASRAFQLSKNLSREDRLVVEGGYRLVNHEYEKAIDVYRTLFTLFPDNLDYGLRLAEAQDDGSKPNDSLATVATLRKLPASDDPRIDLREAKDWMDIGNYQRAQEPLQRAVEKGKAQGARLLVGDGLDKQCKVSQYLGQKEKALAACREARDTYAAAGDYAAEATSLLNWADAIMESDAPQAIELDRQALDTFRRIGHEGGVASAMNSLGLIYSDQGNLEAAEKMHRDALALYRALSDTGRVAAVTANLANARTSQGDLAGAMKLYEEAVGLYRESGDADGVAIAGYNMANVRELRGDLAGAKLGFEESLKAWEKSGDSFAAGYALFSIGQVLLKEGDLAGARQALERALTIRKGSGEKIILAETEAQLAEVSLEEGNAPSEAEAVFRQAIEEFKTEKERDDEAQTWALLARSLVAEKKLDEAKRAAGQALSLAQKGRNFEIRMDNAIVAARVEGLGGGSTSDFVAGAAATKQLEAILSQARKRGYVGVELEARLLMCEMEARKDPVEARLHAQALMDEARSRGFALIARKAGAI